MESEGECLKKAEINYEIANSISHGIGLLLSIPALVLLLHLATSYGTTRHVVCVGIYGFSLVSVYAASTLYHGFQERRIKKIFEIIDHCAIYLLIAGTYTPFTVLVLKNEWGWGLSVTIWTMAFAGIIFKLFYTGRFEMLSTMTYVLMGWLVLVAAKPMMESLTPDGWFWLMAGGITYSVGVIFYLWRKLPYHHVIWHVLVICGSACHYYAIVCYTLPTPSMALNW